MPNLEKGLRRARASVRPPVGNLATAPAYEVATPDSALPFDLARLRYVEPDKDWLEQNRVVVDEISAASASYKMLRTRVLQRMRPNGWRTLAVTSAGPGEGKTLTAVNLAVQLARHAGTSVVLVDLDLRNPSIHHRLGIEPRYGLLDHLHDNVPLERIGVRLGMDGLGVILNDEPTPDSSELLTSAKVATLVDTLKAGDDRIVIFDMPPMLAADDFLAFAPLVDAVLLVVAEGKTTRANLGALQELLQNVNVIGTVLNASAEKTAPYSYYYGHGREGRQTSRAT
jgi:protein-tyrosine kinase